MWWRFAYEGQKVVYVDDSGGAESWLDGVPIGGDPLAVGDTVTIKEIEADPGFVVGVGFWFGHYDADGRKLWYGAHRFRPVQTKSTDTGMAICKRILEHPEQRIEEDA